MPRNPESSKSTQGVDVTVQPTEQATSFDRLTKAEFIEILNCNIKRPITPTQFHRCAMSIVSKWCGNVVNGRYASIVEVTSRLEALEKIYQNR